MTEMLELWEKVFKTYISIFKDVTENMDIMVIWETQQRTKNDKRRNQKEILKWKSKISEIRKLLNGLNSS